MWSPSTVSIPSFYYRTDPLNICKDDIAVIVDGTRAPGMPTICSTVHCARGAEREFRANLTGSSIISRFSLHSFAEGEQPYLGGSIFFNTGMIVSCRFDQSGDKRLLRLNMRGLSGDYLAEYNAEFARVLEAHGTRISGVPIASAREELTTLLAPRRLSTPIFRVGSILDVESVGTQTSDRGLAICLESSPDGAIFQWLSSEESPGLRGTFSVSAYIKDFRVVGSPSSVRPSAERNYIVRYKPLAMNSVLTGEARCMKNLGENRYLMIWADTEANNKLGLSGTFSMSDPPQHCWAEREA